MVSATTRQQRRAAAAAAAVALMPALIGASPLPQTNATTVAAAATTTAAATTSIAATTTVAAPVATSTAAWDANVRFATAEQHAAVLSCNALYPVNMVGLNQKCVIRSNAGNLWCTSSKAGTVGNTQYFYDADCLWTAADGAKCSVM
ncbi:hypothetical protein CXG81DRAFT_28613 [Caulochytrium protostelioides]|uniref:Uncharacterized protein n=1 Tax=Caulochytrium protostelioides TaxID=1555241 RepID=A0A4V1ITX4_9FUNG|nr:hypothetical protein CXG81DRAFT_28613 [Caulochytrium protostelioides]|eukprot:RKO98567.1 hypothetical protein CXG81DRAFT_28613 [Caulochytrium protostelioides]